MNTTESQIITIVLSDIKNAGTVAKLLKDFNIYQKSQQSILLNVLVPKSLIGDEIKKQYFDINGQMITESGVYTALKTGMLRVDKKGNETKTDSYYLRFIKEIREKGKEYYFYQREWPNAFSFVPGTGLNAPELVFNLVNILNNISVDESGEAIVNKPTTINTFTSQKCRIDVLPSTELDKDPPMQPTEWDLLQGQVDKIIQSIMSIPGADKTILKYNLLEELPQGVAYNADGFKSVGIFFYNAEFDIPNLDYSTDRYVGAVIVTNAIQHDGKIKQTESFFYDNGISQRVIELNDKLEPVDIGEWSVKVDRKQSKEHVGEFLYVDKKGNINFTKALKDFITKSNDEVISEDTSSYEFSEDFKAVAKNKEEIRIELSDEAKNLLSNANSLASELAVSIDPDTYIMKVALLNTKGDEISSEIVDLPLESMIIDGRYENGYIYLQLQSGTEINFSIASLISGLVPTTRKINGRTLDKDIEIPIPTKLSELSEKDYNSLDNLPIIPEGVEVIDNLESERIDASASANMARVLNETKLDKSSIDDEISFRSENPVQNKVVAKALIGRENSSKAFEPSVSLSPSKGIFADGKYLIVGNNGILYSEDGVNWEHIDFYSGWKDVCYAKDKFVIVGSAVSAVSSNGIDWETTTLGNRTKWDCVAYGNGTLVASYSNKFSYKKGDNDWVNDLTFPKYQGYSGMYDFAPEKIKFMNGKFFGIGKTGQNGFIYSYDGITWKYISGTTQDIAYNGNLFVRIDSGMQSQGSTATVRLYYSEDLVNWKTTICSGDKSSLATLYSIDGGNGKFAAVSGLNGIVYSDDGLNWKVWDTPDMEDMRSSVNGSKIQIIFADDNFLIYSQIDPNKIVIFSPEAKIVYDFNLTKKIFEFYNSKTQTLRSKNIELNGEDVNNHFFSLDNAESIPANADLNEYKQSGNYACKTGDETISTIKNKPSEVTSVFTMKVYSSNGSASGSYPIQEITTFNLQRYIRRFNNDSNNGSGAWTEWYKIMTDKEINSKYYSVGPSQIIPANADLNNYTLPGNYAVYNADFVESIKNKPEGVNHIFYIRNIAINGMASTNYISQELTSFLQQKFVRTYNGDNKPDGTKYGWTQWKQIITSDSLLDQIYPIGAVYISVNKVSPASFIGGNWQQLPRDYALWTETHSVNYEQEGVDVFNAGVWTIYRKIAAGLPNITGTVGRSLTGGQHEQISTATGAFSDSYAEACAGAHSYSDGRYAIYSKFDASKSNSIYGGSITVQPPAYKIHAWKRVS